MMEFRRTVAVLIGLAACSLFMVRAQAAQNRKEGKTIVINQRIATSTFFTSNFGFAGTPPGSANLALYSGEGSEGKFTGQGISQSAPTGTCTLPDGSPDGLELKLVGHVASSKFSRTGDLLFERGGPGDLVACLDPRDKLPNGAPNPNFQSFHETGTVLIVGGTGRFAGAQGIETVIQDGSLISPTDANGAFGFSVGSFKATFTVPK